MLAMYQVLTTLQAIVRLAREAGASGLSEVSFMFWCRRGRHRSVVMVLLARAVMQSMGYQVTDSSR